jgi:hypothetical protein
MRVRTDGSLARLAAATGVVIGLAVAPAGLTAPRDCRGSAVGQTAPTSGTTRPATATRLVKGLAVAAGPTALRDCRGAAVRQAAPTSGTNCCGARCPYSDTGCDTGPCEECNCRCNGQEVVCCCQEHGVVICVSMNCG